MSIEFTDKGLQGVDPYDLFSLWFAEAQVSEPNDANAMALACCDSSGRVSLRMVLLKEHVRAGADEGFVFYTNFESDKGKALLENPTAALLFHWKSLERQIRIEGCVSVVSDSEADAYFAARPRDSRIGAWVSRQSRPLKSAHVLRREVALAAVKYNIGKVPRPRHWSGFRVRPQRMEFWRSGKFRLHDRFVFQRQQDRSWQCQRLYP